MTHLVSRLKRLLTPGADFFRHMEGGVRATMQQQREDWINHLQQLRSEAFDLCLPDLPCLTLLEAAFRRVNPAKATGPDGIDAALCHHCPALFAKKTFPLLLRTVLHGEEGLIFKGGRLQALWKNKGPRNQCSSFRSILISSHIGKSIHRCLRVHSALPGLLKEDVLGCSFWTCVRPFTAL